MFNRKVLLGVLGALAIGGSAQATTLNIAVDGSWNEFDVDDLLSQSFGTEWIDGITGPAGYTGDGSPLSFTFTVPFAARVDIVDAGFAGDTYKYVVNDDPQQSTSAVPATAVETPPANAGTDFDAAFADHANFSYASFFLGAGTYTLVGQLDQSVTFGGGSLNATVGAVRVSAVPVPAAVWLLGSAAGVLGGLRRRRA